MPTSVIGVVTERPAMTMLPRLRLRSPATISISVLLPHPEGPTTDTNSPGSTSTLTSFNARNGLSVSSPKIFETRSILMGTPHFEFVATSSVIAQIPRSCPSDLRCGGGDSRQRHLRNQQR